MLTSESTRTPFRIAFSAKRASRQIPGPFPEKTSRHEYPSPNIGTPAKICDTYATVAIEKIKTENSTGCLGLRQHEGFFGKAREDYQSLADDIANPGAAIICIRSLCHLHEWVWSSWLKSNFTAQAMLGIRNNKEEFIEWLSANCSHFGLLQELPNGTKHYIPVHSTKRAADDGRGPYGIGRYGAPYLLIDLGDSVENAERYLVAKMILGEIARFWAAFSTDNDIRDPGNYESELEAGSEK